MTWDGLNSGIHTPPSQGGDINELFKRISKLENAQVGTLTGNTGTSTITFTAAGSSAGPTASIAHGLALTPTQVLATARPTADNREDYIMTCASRDSINLTFRLRAAAGEHVAVASGTVVTFDWIAIG